MKAQSGNNKRTGDNKQKTVVTTQKPAGIPSKPSSEPVLKNRQKILNTALRLFTQYGVDATPTARISREAGVSTGTLFHYFPDKGRLVAEVYVFVKKEIASIARHDDDPSLPTRERIEKAVRVYVAWGIKNPLKVRFLNQCYNYPVIDREIQDQICNEFSWMTALFSSAAHEGLVPEIPFEFHTVMTHHITNGILELIEYGDSGMSDEEIIKNGLAMLWKINNGFPTEE